MSSEIDIAVVGRKDRDWQNTNDTTYRVIGYPHGTYDSGEPRVFHFPYFKNSFVFDELRNRFENGRWDIIKKNIEGVEMLDWYFNDTTYNLDDHEYNPSYGHSWFRLKELRAWIDEVKAQSRESQTEVGEDGEEYSFNFSAELDELQDALQYIYDSALTLLRFDMLLEDERELLYDFDNSVVVFKFTN